MAPIGLPLTSVIPGGSATADATDAGGVAPALVIYHVPPASQAPAAPSDATQQDTVTLSGKSPATRSQTSSQNFVPAAAVALLAHEFTFPPNDSEDGAGAFGSASSTSAVALSNQTTVAQEPPPAPILAQRSVNATAVATGANAAQPASGTNRANAAANSANSLPSVSASALAPEETLQQLDQELQRLGINPQDISLMNRMSLLLWVNDPVALRQFVQGMQPSAVSSEKNTATNASNAQTSTAQFGAGSSATANQGASAAAIQSETVLSQAQNPSAATTHAQTQSSVPEANQNSAVALSSSAESGGSSGSANPPQQQTAAAVLALQQLQASLGFGGQAAPGANAGGGNVQAQGQFVNISA